jgi:alpha-glucosidase
LRVPTPRIFASAVILVLSAAAVFGQEKDLALKSPDGELMMRFAIRPAEGGAQTGGRLVYSLDFRGKAVFEDSALGLDLDGAGLLGSNVHVTGSDAGDGVDEYTLATGKTSKVRDEYRSLTLRVAENGTKGRALTIEARAYNGGVAFRYVLPEQPRAIGELRLRQEATEFHFSTDAMTWALALPNYRSSYESEYVHLPVSALANQGGVASHFLVGLPLLAHVPGVAWVALLEANLEGNAGMYLTNPSGSWEGRSLTALLSPQFERPELATTGWLPYHSAWRVVLVADDPGRLIESNLLTNLNPQNRLQDSSWVVQGKASWDWWNGDLGPDGKRDFTTENMKRYIDFSAESGFPYFMLDAGWSAEGDITKMRGPVDVPELVRYGATKNVKVWIWLHSAEVMRQMKEAFALYDKWGVAGLKIDFINRDDQEGIQFYYDVAREAAAHHLMVDFHGASKPWGIERTYPNVMSYEGVIGMEQSRAGRRDSPVSRTVLPFTRMLAGPVDYTPGGFNNVTEDGFVARDINPMVMGTRAQHLALYVVFQTPFQMVSDSPQAYKNQPGFQFIKDVPVVWDETRVLSGSVGEFITIARRKGGDWYLGGITNWTARDLKIPLTFLGNGRFEAEIYTDAADADVQPTHMTIAKKTVSGADALTVHLAKGGGCAIRFVRKD